MGVGIGEEHRLLGELGHVGRLVILRAVRSAVHPTHVVDKKEDNVGLRRMQIYGQYEKSQCQQPSGTPCFVFSIFHCFFLSGVLCQILFVSCDILLDLGLWKEINEFTVLLPNLGRSLLPEFLE